MGQLFLALSKTSDLMVCLNGECLSLGAPQKPDKGNHGLLGRCRPGGDEFVGETVLGCCPKATAL